MYSLSADKIYTNTFKYLNTIPMIVLVLCTTIACDDDNPSSPTMDQDQSQTIDMINTMDMMVVHLRKVGLGCTLTWKKC